MQSDIYRTRGRQKGQKAARMRLFHAIFMVAAALVAGCGLSRVRSSQDWSKVSDDRLRLTCHVGNYGSGVFLKYDGKVAWVLTCAHLVSSGSNVSIYFHSRSVGAYRDFRGTVVAVGHPHKDDLALIHCKNVKLDREPFETKIAGVSDFDRGQLSLMNIAFGAEERPFVHDCPAFLQRLAVKTVIPDKSGATQWSNEKILLHGGIVQANSGSPVFSGNELIGLVESAPSVGIRDGRAVQGVLVSSPSDLNAFLSEAGFAVQK